MRTVSTGIVATGLCLAAGCGVGSDVTGGLDETESSVNVKKLQYEAVDITTAPAGQQAPVRAGRTPTPVTSATRTEAGCRADKPEALPVVSRDPAATSPGCPRAKAFPPTEGHREARIRREF